MSEPLHPAQTPSPKATEAAAVVGTEAAEMVVATPAAGAAWAAAVGTEAVWAAAMVAARSEAVVV